MGVGQGKTRDLDRGEVGNQVRARAPTVPVMAPVPLASPESSTGPVLNGPWAFQSRDSLSAPAGPIWPAPRAEPRRPSSSADWMANRPA